VYFRGILAGIIEYFLINAKWLNVSIIHLIALGLARLGNIVAETLFLAMFPWVAKLAGNEQNVLLPRWQNEETRKTKDHACAL